LTIIPQRRWDLSALKDDGSIAMIQKPLFKEDMDMLFNEGKIKFWSMQRK